MPNFNNINYLKNGTAKQKSAYQTLKSNNILEKLSEFNPILTGTIPIEIDIPESDLDIICYWKDKAKFIEIIKISFSKMQDFFCRDLIINDQETIIANFSIDTFEIEIFGQNIPTKDQNAYKHMIIEHQILLAKGNDFREEVVKLKLQGLKTEPAFAKLLQLAGDPYISLLNYK